MLIAAIFYPQPTGTNNHLSVKSRTLTVHSTANTNDQIRIQWSAQLSVLFLTLEWMATDKISGLIKWDGEF